MASDPRTVIAGGGLVGALWALRLAQRGERVLVLERRADPRSGAALEGRSINMAISARGLHALEQVGLRDLALAHALPMTGRMIHGRHGTCTLQRYGRDDSQRIHSIGRAWLNQMLLEHAAARPEIELVFDCRVLDVADGGARLQIERSGEAAPRWLDARALYGTDGGGSAVRHALQRQGHLQIEEQTLAHGYKELRLPPVIGGGFRLAPNALHIWPRGHFMLIALPNPDGSFTCTLFLPFDGAQSFAALDTPAAVERFFAEHFTDVASAFGDLAEQFLQHPVGRMTTVRCTPWHHQRTLLLGDAAHAIVPFFGQGMNCGFEDCTELAHALAATSELEAAFAAFSSARKRQSDAIADMALENFIEMRDKTGDPDFAHQKAIETQLLQAFPRRFSSRYTAVSFSLTPYRDAYEHGERAARAVQALARETQVGAAIDLARADHWLQQHGFDEPPGGELTPV